MVVCDYLNTRGRERREEKRRERIMWRVNCIFFQDVHDSLSLQLFSPSHLHQPTTPSLLCRWNETLWRACNDGRREDQLSSESNKISDPPSQPQPQLALVYTAFEGSVPMVNLDVFAIQVMTTSCRGPWRVFFPGMQTKPIIAETGESKAEVYEIAKKGEPLLGIWEVSRPSPTPGKEVEVNECTIVSIQVYGSRQVFDLSNQSGVCWRDQWNCYYEWQFWIIATTQLVTWGGKSKIVRPEGNQTPCSAASPHLLQCCFTGIFNSPLPRGEDERAQSRYLCRSFCYHSWWTSFPLGQERICEGRWPIREARTSHECDQYRIGSIGSARIDDKSVELSIVSSNSPIRILSWKTSRFSSIPWRRREERTSYLLWRDTTLAVSLPPHHPC